jgi:RNA polymerase sigma factor (sigma-70 family)
VFTIATNKVRDFWRTRRHKDAQLEANLDEEERRLRAPSKDPGPLPELEREEMSRELSKAIDELPPGMRETLVLRYFEGLSFEEIGARIGRNGPPCASGCTPSATRGARAVRGAWTSAPPGRRMTPAQGNR